MGAATEAAFPMPRRLNAYLSGSEQSRLASASPAPKSRQRKRDQDPENVARMRIARNAKNAVQRAIKAGRLTRPERCEQCQKTGTIEASHADYSKPLEVRWLCQSCHRREDALHPKTR